MKCAADYVHGCDGCPECIPCDASVLINGADDVGDCTAKLDDGESCTQSGGAGFTCTASSCLEGALTAGTCTGIDCINLL